MYNTNSIGNSYTEEVYQFEKPFRSSSGDLRRPCSINEIFEQWPCYERIIGEFYKAAGDELENAIPWTAWGSRNSPYHLGMFVGECDISGNPSGFGYLLSFQRGRMLSLYKGHFAFCDQFKWVDQKESMQLLERMTLCQKRLHCLLQVDVVALICLHEGVVHHSNERIVCK